MSVVSEVYQHQIRKFRGDIPASQIPVFDVTDRTYYLIDEHGSRLPVTGIYALELLDAAGSLSRDTVQ